jgi:hypothetical protein
VAAEDHLSNELFFQVHRGLYIKPGEKLESEHTGTHWSALPDVAEGFARRGVIFPGSTRVIYHANVPISSVETRTNILKRKEVGGKWRAEQEVPARFSSPVFVTGRTTLRGEGDVRSRKRTYNPPREMKA